MRNLFYLIFKYNHFFLFLALEVVCFYLLIQHQYFHSSRFANVAYEVTGEYYEGYTNAVEYFNLRRVNDSLMAENAELRNQLNNSYYNNRPRNELRAQDTVEAFTVEGEDIKDTSFKKQQYRHIPANVINNSVTKRNNYITLDKGSKQGIEKRMGVVSSDGVVGIVKTISPHFSVVISILHNDFRLSAKIRESGQVGSVTWDGVDPKVVQLKDVPMYVDIKQGQTVVTSHYSGIFPEGIPIGEIIDYKVKKGDNFFTIDLKLNTTLRNLKYVYVIQNKMQEEQQKLEEVAKE